MRYETELRNKNRGYMNLIVWQKAMDLFGLVWQLIYEEAKIDFKLRSQLADATQSTSANISEGYGRRSINEYIQFLYYALGSLAETMASEYFFTNSSLGANMRAAASSKPVRVIKRLRIPPVLDLWSEYGVMIT